LVTDVIVYIGLKAASVPYVSNTGRWLAVNIQRSHPVGRLLGALCYFVLMGLLGTIYGIIRMAAIVLVCQPRWLSTSRWMVSQGTSLVG
jgi:hypothetical protein